MRPAQSSSQPTATAGTQAVPTLAREDSARRVPPSTLGPISPILINSDDDEEVYDEEDSYNSDATIPYVDSEEDDYPYHGDEEPRAKVARLSDGTVVSGSSDNTIRLWRPTSSGGAGAGAGAGSA